MRQHFWWHCKPPAGGKCPSPLQGPVPGSRRWMGAESWLIMMRSPRTGRSPSLVSQHNSPAIRKLTNSGLYCLLVILRASWKLSKLNILVPGKTQTFDGHRLLWCPALADLAAELRNLDPRAESRARPETSPCQWTVKCATWEGEHRFCIRFL